MNIVYYLSLSKLRSLILIISVLMLLVIFLILIVVLKPNKNPSDVLKFKTASL